jgi:hypothetical protein
MGVPQILSKKGEGGSENLRVHHFKPLLISCINIWKISLFLNFDTFQKS